MKLKILLAVCILAVIGAVVAYFVWGSRLEAEFERRAAALPARTPPERPPEADNADGPLRAAAKMLDDWLYGDDEEVAAVVGEAWDEEAWTDEYFARARKVWPQLEPYFAKLEEAAARPVFAPPGGTTLWSGQHDHMHMVSLRCALEPEEAPSGIQFLLDLADRWRPENGLAVIGRQVLVERALEILHRGLRDGPVTIGERWDVQLASMDGIRDLQEILQSERAEVVQFYRQLRRGEDPWAETRETVEEANENLESAGLDPLLPELPDPPWYRAWYGHPFLYKNALAHLDTMARQMERAASEETVRKAVTDGGPEFFGRYARMLEHLAILRLARIAMKPELRETLRDPFTGKPFLFEKHADKVVVASPLTKDEELRKRVGRRLSYENLLTWEIRLK